MTRIYAQLALGIICVAWCSSLAQDMNPRVAAMEAQGRYAEVLPLFVREADSSPVAQYFVADYTYHGRKGVERDEDKGKAYYRKALGGLLPLAEQGDATAQYRVARCIEFGNADIKAAKAWYARAAEGGNTQAMCRYVILEMNDTPYGEAPAYLKRAMELGDPDAKAWQGAILVGKKETQTEGLALLREAAAAGSPIALTRLASLCYLGEAGVEKNLEMAVKLLQEAVDRGFSEGIVPLEMLSGEHRHKAAQAKLAAARDSIRPGHGFPGRLAAYPVTPQLKGRLERFNLTAGWFYRDPVNPQSLNPGYGDLLANELPYLLFTPRRGQQPVPIVIYFGGTGEHGTDLIAQFNQTTIFSKITSPEFQKQYPCYLFAPMVPKDTYLRCFKGKGTAMSDLVCDALYALIREANHPPVDTNRMYLTGLSYGGSAAYTFPFGYPGRFAASLPVAGFATAENVPEQHPGNIWLLYNEHEYASEIDQQVLANIARAITERGGEFRSSTFPDKGHNSWDKAWREDAVWDWVFSKTADGKPVAQSTGPAKPVVPPKRPGLFLDGAICTAAKPGRDDGTGPERAADGLEATCYVSVEPVARGDWWQIEFVEPVSGRITVKSGTRDGKNRVSSARVETSSDGQTWASAGRFQRTSGECRFVPRDPIKYLRVVSESPAGEILVLREVVVAR